MTGILWHNPRCSTSRAALALLAGRGVSPEIRLYLDDPPAADEIARVIALTGRPAIDLVRQKEPEFRALGLSPDSDAQALVAAMAAHPRLIERPVFINGDRAALGRPPEAVLKIL